MAILIDAHADLERFLDTDPTDESLPRYVRILGQVKDHSYCSRLVIDRHQISIIDPEGWRIRVGGVWVRLYNPKLARCGGLYG